MACKCVSRKVAKISLWITLIILILSVVMIVVFPSIYKNVLKHDIALSEGSIVTEIWKDIPLPIYEKLYFFNITNKDAFLQGHEPLNVTEVGPYTYKSEWIKKNPVWNANDTVSYREIRTYHFVRDMSNGTENDEIYTLNGPMIIASNIAKDYDEILRALLSIILSIEGEDMIIRKKIKELAYEGYEDIIIKYAPILKPDVPFKDGIFSWLYGKNATDDGLFTVFTGVDDPSKTNFINNWNGENKLTFWKGDSCNMMNGTNVETGPPIKGHQDNYSFFQSILCRSLTLNYTEDKEHYDVLSKRFKPTYELFANSSENPDNYCFEVEKERPSGILDISPCQFGAPVFISFPHFHLGDSSYLDSVNGLSPNDEEHGSHLDVEPITGLTINAIIRFQINLELTKTNGVFQTYKAKKGVFPVLWVELNLQINEDLANFLKSKVKNPKIITYSVLGALAAVSLILAIVCFVVLCSSESDDEDDPLIDASDKPHNYDKTQGSKNSNNVSDCKGTTWEEYQKDKVSSEYQYKELPEDM